MLEKKGDKREGVFIFLEGALEGHSEVNPSSCRRDEL